MAQHALGDLGHARSHHHPRRVVSRPSAALWDSALGITRQESESGSESLSGPWEGIVSGRPPGPLSEPPGRESTDSTQGSILIDQDDLDWLIQRAELAEELDPFCTSREDQSRLHVIKVACDRL